MTRPVKQMRMFSNSLIGVVAAGAVMMAFTKDVWAANLVSYRAVYDIRMASAKPGAGFASASGQLAYGVKQACDAWLVNQAGTTHVETTDGDVISWPMNFSSWESSDGAHYRFTVMGDDVSPTILGGARMGADGGEAKFSKPEAAVFALSSDTLFPMVHTAYILDQAGQGKTQLQNMVFEGISVEGSKLLVTFVSTLSKRAGTIAGRFNLDAVKRPGWTFRLAYFDPVSRASEPMYEIEADYLDNGIPVRWMIDYGDYVLEMDMTKIEILPRPDC